MNDGAAKKSRKASDPNESGGTVDSLESLLAPVTLDTFLTEHLDKKPLHVRGGAAKFARMMSWDVLTMLLNQRVLWNPSTLSMVMDAVTLPPQEFCRNDRTMDGQVGRVVDQERVRGWLQRGASLVLNRIETLTPELRAFVDGLARDMCVTAQCNLYCSWRGHQAFPSHFDTHDVFAVHIAGEKRWNIYQRHFESPVLHPKFKSLDQAFHEQHKGPVSQVVDMEPGDLLYIPRGYYHDAMASSTGTIHIAVSALPLLGLDILTALFERGLMDPVARGSIPNPALQGEAAFEAYLDKLVERVGEFFAEPSFRDHIRGLVKANGVPQRDLHLTGDGVD